MSVYRHSSVGGGEGPAAFGHTRILRGLVISTINEWRISSLVKNCIAVITVQLVKQCNVAYEWKIPINKI